ncbi:hypothetical protein [Cohnella terricola]|uniref:hypothetical protein n=1 Tax=Cohnella terricola TaxID=1289167 RepID=UPI001648A12B|nr:hypothetical protein [Cohnella terricola]
MALNFFLPFSLLELLGLEIGIQALTDTSIKGKKLRGMIQLGESILERKSDLLKIRANSPFCLV